MEDRGEKIVTLARAILHNPANAREKEHGKYSLKTLLLVTILSAAGAAAVSVYAAEYFRPLNHYERTELLALIHYAAQVHHIDRTALQTDFFKNFGISSFDEMTRAQMDAARSYLQKGL